MYEDNTYCCGERAGPDAFKLIEGLRLRLHDSWLCAVRSEPRLSRYKRLLACNRAFTTFVSDAANIVGSANAGVCLTTFRDPIGLEIIHVADVSLKEDAIVTSVAEFWLKELDLAEEEFATVMVVARSWVLEARVLRQGASISLTWMEWAELTAAALARIETELPAWIVPETYRAILVSE